MTMYAKTASPWVAHASNTAITRTTVGSMPKYAAIPPQTPAIMWSIAHAQGSRSLNPHGLVVLKPEHVGKGLCRAFEPKHTQRQRGNTAYAGILVIKCFKQNLFSGWVFYETKRPDRLHPHPRVGVFNLGKDAVQRPLVSEPGQQPFGLRPLKPRHLPSIPEPPTANKAACEPSRKGLPWSAYVTTGIHHVAHTKNCRKNIAERRVRM